MNAMVNERSKRAADSSPGWSEAEPWVPIPVVIKACLWFVPASLPRAALRLPWAKFFRRLRRLVESLRFKYRAPI